MPAPISTAPFFHLLPSYGSVWPALPGPGNALIWSAYQTLEQSQWLSTTQLAERQFAQLRALLRHGVEHVPYYRELLRRHGIRPDSIQSPDDLQRIPILQRQVYQQRIAEFEAGRLPSGVVAAGEGKTSGTTGVPVRTLRTNLTQRWWHALFLRDLAWCGMDPRGRLAAIRPRVDAVEPQRFASWLDGLDTLLESGPSYLLSSSADPERQLDWLNELQPDYCLSTPSSLEHLAGLSRERGLSWPSIKAVQCIAESLNEPVRERIAAGFGAPVNNTYSCEEAGYLASPCPAGHGLHVHAETVLLEVVDDQGRPCPPGVTGQVLLTTLHNSRAPLVRYAIGDEAALGAPCPCGRGLPLLVNLTGKTRPLLLLNDGSRLDPQLLVQALYAVSGYHQFQFIQRGVDDVLIRLVPDQTFDSALAEQMAGIVRQHISPATRVEIETLQRIPPLANGKFQGFIVAV